MGLSLLSSALVDRVLSFLPLADLLSQVQLISRSWRPLRPSALSDHALAYTDAVQRVLTQRSELSSLLGVGSLAFLDAPDQPSKDRREEEEGEGGEDDDEGEGRVGRISDPLVVFVASAARLHHLRRLRVGTTTRSLSSPSLLPTLFPSTPCAFPHLHALALMGNASEPGPPPTLSTSLAALRHLPSLATLIVRACLDGQSFAQLLSLPLRRLDLQLSRITSPSLDDDLHLRLHPDLHTLHLPCTREDSLSGPVQDGLDGMLSHYSQYAREVGGDLHSLSFVDKRAVAAGGRLHRVPHSAPGGPTARRRGADGAVDRTGGAASGSLVHSPESTRPCDGECETSRAWRGGRHGHLSILV